MKVFKICVAGFFAGCLLMLAAACGKSAAPVPSAEEAKPFIAAVGEYLRAESMGMAVAAVEQLQVESSTAKAVCRMKEAESSYGLTVTWEFLFQKDADGWKVKGRHAPR